MAVSEYWFNVQYSKTKDPVRAISYEFLSALDRRMDNSHEKSAFRATYRHTYRTAAGAFGL